MILSIFHVLLAIHTSSFIECLSLLPILLYLTFFFELYAFYLFYIQFFLPDIYSYIFSYSIKYQILHGSVLDIIKQPHVEPV